VAIGFVKIGAIRATV